jgi:hypothetical protein
MGQRRVTARLGKRTALVAAGVVVVGMLAVGLGSAWADTNLAAGKAATGSAPCRQTEGPGKAVNGTVDKGLRDKWCSNTGSGTFLQVDLGSSAQVGRFVVRHAGSGHEKGGWNTRDFTISVSTDGKSFTRVATVAGNTADVTEAVVPTVAARYLRLDITIPTSTGDHAARIYEFEAYQGEKAAPSPSVTSPVPSTVAPTTTAAPAPTTTAAPTPTKTTNPTESCHTDAVATVTDYVAQHGDAMTRKICNSDVAVYFDADLAALPATGTAWIGPFVTDVWRHLKASYGECAVKRTLPAPIGPACENFGAPKPALAFFHQGKHGGGTVANRFDSFSGFRTTLDVGDSGWNVGNGVLHDEIVHEACHQAEGASQGVHESPAFSVWGDSKWAEFCVYDFYARTGRTADADRVLKLFTNGRDNLPTGAQGAAWFRDWFLPLWKDGGNNAAVMQRYFGLLSQYFPTRSENGGRNVIYTRRMTTGEYVHFTSAAAGKDLSARAATAFGSGFVRADFEKAQRDFPQMKY